MPPRLAAVCFLIQYITTCPGVALPGRCKLNKPFSPQVGIDWSECFVTAIEGKLVQKLVSQVGYCCDRPDLFVLGRTVEAFGTLS